jgi:hypothetical protein
VVTLVGLLAVVRIAGSGVGPALGFACVARTLGSESGVGDHARRSGLIQGVGVKELAVQYGAVWCGAVR